MSDSISQARVTCLLALCREEEPAVHVRLSEVPFAQHVRGLSGDLYDAGFAQSVEVDDGLIAAAAWAIRSS